MKNVILSPSLLACDFSRVGEQLSELKEAGVTALHLDVMDGIFVPNISFGQPVVKSLRKVSDLFFDVHLMITDPERYIDSFIEAGADGITFHYEATSDSAGILEKLRSKGIKAGLSIKPKTPAAAIEDLLPLCDMALVMSVEPGFGGQKYMREAEPKIAFLREYADAHNLPLSIQVDGGIDAVTAITAVKAGADNLVAGSSVFKGNIKESVNAILSNIITGDN